MTQMHTDRICVSTLCLHMTYLYQYAGQGRSQGRAKEAQAPSLGSGVIHVKGPNSRFFPCLWGGSRIRIRDEYLPLPPPPPLGQSWLCHCGCTIYILPVLCDYYTSQNSLHSPSSYGLSLQQNSYEISRFLLQSEAVGGRRV